MKPKTIFIINTILIVLFIGIRLLITFVPNREERLRRAQEEYSPGEDGSAAAEIDNSEERFRHAQEEYSPGEDDSAAAEIDNSWAYFLINAEFPLPEGYEPSLMPVQGTFMMDERCAQYAKEMIAAAEADGVKLKVVSAYRSLQKQKENLESYILRLKNEGFSSSEAESLARDEIAEPGTSEHNAGLALDILTEDWWETHDDVTADFENTEEYLWLSANAHKYGFILRYPKGDEDVTGYAYEPWHYRFVGIYYAGEIRRSGLPFEYFYIGAKEVVREDIDD